MKKINSKTIIILGIIVALLVSLVASASAAYTKDASSATIGYSTDDGYVTMDSLVNSRSTGATYVRDLFVTGGIGTAESTGILSRSGWAYDDQAHWTLKDGVLVIDGPSNGSVTIGVPTASPFWNNQYIETVVISENIYSIDSGVEGALFYFGLPNLKTVIFLGDTVFNPRQFDKNNNQLFGDFPTDHQVNYVWASMNNGMYKSQAAYAYGKPGVGTSNDIADFASASDKNSFFADRSAWLTAAAPVIANAKLNQQAIDLMPADMVSAVNAIGGFKNTANGTVTQIVTEPAAAPAAPASDGISVTVNGKTVAWTDATPFIDANSRTMVPLRAVADAMGLEVIWAPETTTARFKRADYGIISFGINDTFASTLVYADNDAGLIMDEVQMDTAAVIVNDRTYAPIRYLAEFFGYSVAWDAATRTVVISG